MSVPTWRNSFEVGSRIHRKLPEPSEIRAGFFTLPQAHVVLATSPAWASSLKGDLQMHTQWSDGSGSIAEMADAAASRGCEYLAITDHSQGKIAGGIDETNCNSRQPKWPR